MLLEEDVAVQNHEEIPQPPRRHEEAAFPAECRREAECRDRDEEPTFPITPPPMPWPRVFPSL
jgi:hypothetical protein